jgi:hypothetical protein
LKTRVGKRIESIHRELYVPIDENKIIVTESVGADNYGEYWENGFFTWEVWHEDILLISNDFYIEPIGLVTKDENPYFDFLSLKLFEAPSSIPPVDQRKYLSRFMYNATRFIWAELQMQNKNPNLPWMGEFVFNFYNDIKELIGRSVKMEVISGGDKNNVVTMFAGIGSDTQVTWPQDLYTVEVVFMDT